MMSFAASSSRNAAKIWRLPCPMESLTSLLQNTVRKFPCPIQRPCQHSPRRPHKAASLVLKTNEHCSSQAPYPQLFLSRRLFHPLEHIGVGTADGLVSGGLHGNQDIHGLRGLHSNGREGVVVVSAPPPPPRTRQEVQQVKHKIPASSQREVYQQVPIENKWFGYLL